MLNVREASFRRLLPVNGEMLAEVAVRTGQPHNPEWVAYFRRTPNDYELVRVAANDADTTIDWFDNNLHEAFSDITAEVFQGFEGDSKREYEQFADAVLNMEGIRYQLDSHFAGLGK